MGTGYFKVHRKIFENPIVCKDADHFFVWSYLMGFATHTEYDALFNGKRITLQPGQLITGRKSIASVTKVSESKVQRILKTFEIEHQIEQQTNNQNRLVTLLNWNEYQQCEQRNEQQVNNERTTTEQRVNTNKNVKKVNKDKNDKNISPTEISALDIAMNDFRQMRTKIRAPLTDRAEQLIRSKLNDLAAGDERKQISILNQSIERGWRGVFQLKEDGNATPVRGTNASASSGKTTRPRFDFSGTDVPV